RIIMEQEIKNTEKKNEVKWYHKKWVRFVAGALAVVMIISTVSYAILRAQLTSVYSDLADSDDTLKSVSQRNVQDVGLKTEYDSLIRYSNIFDLIGKENYKDAIEETKNAIDTEENAVIRDGLEELLAELYYNEQMFKECVDMADKCINNHKDPQDILYYLRGIGYVQTGEYSLAGEDLKRCLESDDISRDSVILQLAISTYSDKNYDDAASYSEEYLMSEKDEDFFDDGSDDFTEQKDISNENLCRYIGAVSCMHTEEFGKSVEYLDKLIDVSEDSELYYYRGVDHMALENYEMAVADLAKAKELGKNETVVHYDMGICLVTLGRVDEGVEELKYVIEKNDSPELTTSSTNILTALAQEY
nr:hypothetical protein [Lachnospiraceae bacterium]